METASTDCDLTEICLTNAQYHMFVKEKNLST